MLRPPRGRSRRGSRRSTRSATPPASETRYDADPSDLIDGRRRAPRARRARSWRSTTRTRAGRPSPARPTCRENHYGAVPRIIVSLLDATARGPGLAARPRDRTRSSPGRSSRAGWRRVETAACRRRVAAKLPVSCCSEDRRDRVDELRRYRRSLHPASTSLPCSAPLIIFKPDCVQRRLVGQILAAVRGQGAAGRRPEADPGRPRPGREALRRAPGQAVLRGPDRLHHRRPGGRRRARRERGDRRRPRRCSARPTAWPPPRARSAATSRSASRTTSSTAATAPSRPHARSPSGSGPRRSSTTPIAGDEWVFSGDLIGTPNMARASRKKGVFANPFYVGLMVVSTLFVVTALGLPRQPLRPGARPAPPRGSLA